MKKIIITLFLIINTLTPLSFVSAETTWYFTQTHMSSYIQPDGVIFINKNNQTECAEERELLLASGIDTNIFAISECREKVTAPSGEGWVFNITSDTAPILANNPVGFKTEEDCNTRRDDYMKTVSSSGVGLCLYKKGINNEGVVNITGVKSGDVYDPTYHLLAPIGNYKDIKTDEIGKYFDIIFLVVIGLCGVLAVVMIVVGGIMYMGGDSVFDKNEGKKKINNAIIGLLIALGSYALLNTINPDLLGGKGLTIAKARIEIVDKPDAGDGILDPDFNTGNESYSASDSISSGVTEALSKLNNGFSINSFSVSTSNKTMVILISDGSSTQPIPINIGQGGYSENGVGYSGDEKTPKGNWEILEIRKSSGNKPVFNKNGSNMGASFWLLNPTTNGERGIGMHGNKNGTLTSTNGCVRLKNSDILALLPHIKTGISVTIK